MKNNNFKSLFFLIIGFIAGITFFIVLIVFLILFTFSLGNKTPTLINDSWLVLDYSGEISEKPVSKNFTFLSKSGNKIQLLNYLNAIENAALDNRITGIIINGDLTYYSKVHIEEINAALEKFKKSGKNVFAWFSQGNINNYLMCTSADKIYMPDTNSANLTIAGYSQKIPYFKKGFDNLGIGFNVIHIGDFKGTGENFVRDSMSTELKESYSNLIENLNYLSFKQISKSRNIDFNKLKNLINSGNTILMNPDTALNNKFIDAKIKYNELIDSLKTKNQLKTVSIYNYANIIEEEKKESKNKIAIVYAEGMITNYFSSSNNYSQDTIGAKSLIKDLITIKNKKNIKAVIIRINSPGGSALGSELILQTINDLKKIKPVYISFGPVAASGGYYISCKSDRIFSSPSTITGSIGVVSVLMNYEELSKKLGINYEILKENTFDDFLTPVRKPSIQEIEILKKSMLLIYNEFIDHVMENRKIDNQEISKLAEGRIWTGKQAIEKNLSDQIGGIMDTINYTAITNKLDTYSIVSYPKAEDFLSKLSKMSNIQSKLEFNNNIYLKKIIDLHSFYKKNGNNPAFLMPFYEIP